MIQSYPVLALLLGTPEQCFDENNEGVIRILNENKIRYQYCNILQEENNDQIFSEMNKFPQIYLKG